MVSKYYEYATWLLALVVIVLGFLLMRAKNASVDDSLDMAVENLQECNTELATWRTANPTPVTTPEKQEELNNILRRCADATGAEKTDVGNSNMGPESDKTESTQ